MTQNRCLVNKLVQNYIQYLVTQRAKQNQTVDFLRKQYTASVTDKPVSNKRSLLIHLIYVTSKPQSTQTRYVTSYHLKLPVLAVNEYNRSDDVMSIG